MLIYLSLFDHGGRKSLKVHNMTYCRKSEEWKNILNPTPFSP